MNICVTSPYLIILFTYGARDTDESLCGFKETRNISNTLTCITFFIRHNAQFISSKKCNPETDGPIISDTTTRKIIMAPSVCAYVPEKSLNKSQGKNLDLLAVVFPNYDCACSILTIMSYSTYLIYFRALRFAVFGYQ